MMLGRPRGFLRLLDIFGCWCGVRWRRAQHIFNGRIRLERFERNCGRICQEERAHGGGEKLYQLFGLFACSGRCRGVAVLGIAGLVGWLALQAIAPSQVSTGLPSPPLSDLEFSILRPNTAPKKPVINGSQFSISSSRPPVSQPVPVQPHRTTQARANVAYGKLPLYFEANQGQTDEAVKFLTRGRGYTLFLTSAEAVMVFHKPQGKRSAVSHQLSGKAPAIRQQPEQAKGEEAHTKLNTKASELQTVVRMKLVGASREPKVVGIEELPGKSNYFIGKDPKKWRSNIPHYAKVKYEGIYPGIDLVFYGQQRRLEFDFVVAPGADPKLIQIVFEGADKIEINDEGHLVLHTTTGQVQMPKPLVYQEVDGVRKEIAGAYVLNLKSEIENPKSQVVGFQVASYDASRPLIIDPVLVYSTYLGGNDWEDARGISVDSSGNAYIAGTTRSVDFPTTEGAFQTSKPDDACPIPPCHDVFITKLNPSGSALVYSTFLGGSSEDFGGGWESGGGAIAVDESGNAYVTGITASTDFPTTEGAFQRTSGDLTDAFVTKLNPSGSALAYSTYLGGFGNDHGESIAVGASGNAYVTGVTLSPPDERWGTNNFPTTAGAFQTNYNGNGDAFVTKLNSTGSSLVYSSYLGGSGADTATGIAVDSFGNGYITGGTSSVDFPVTEGAFQTEGSPIQNTTVFVTKLNPTGSALVYSTYIRGTFGGSQGSGIAVDLEGNAYITGGTGEFDFPTTAGAFQPICPEILSGGLLCDNAFVTKLNDTGSGLVYSTLLGGTTAPGGGGNDEGYAIAVDSLGNAYVTGVTRSEDFPITEDAIQVVLGGFLDDAFVTVFNPTGTGLLYSTFLGGDSVDRGHEIAIDRFGDVYVSGMTGSPNFPTTDGAFKTTPTHTEAFVAKIADIPFQADLSIAKDGFPDPVTVGNNLTYTVTVVNNGPAKATGVVLTDPLPQGVILVSVTASQGNCGESNSTVTCDLESLTHGVSATVIIVLTPTIGGEITNTASVGANESDANAINNSATVTTTVNAGPPGPLTITASSLPDGELRVFYNASLEISGGVPPYTVSVVQGSLPTGLSVDNGGLISGTPTKAKTSTFTVKVADSAGTSVTKKFKINVFKALSIATKSLKAGTAGKKYSATLKASGGKKPYIWAITSGSLPEGLVLDETTGKITGTPTPAAAGSSELTCWVTDPLGGVAEKTFTLMINLL